MIRVECHHSGGLIWSATAADDAPRLACILQIGRKRPAGKASLNSLDFCHTQNLVKARRERTWEYSDLDDSDPRRPPTNVGGICHAVVSVTQILLEVMDSS
jgi:hypothetical protein